MEQFTEHLSKTTSSNFSPSPPREPTPLRDESKGKEGHLTNEEAMAQVKEMKRLADLKAEKERSEKSLQKIMNPPTIRDQAQKMAEYEAKRKKMLDEYNHQISHRVNQQPITKISYRVNSSKEANLTVYDKFILKTLGLVNGLKKRTSEILWEVFVKENIVVDGMQRSLIPPSGIEGSRGRVIREPESGIFYYRPEKTGIKYLLRCEIGTMMASRRSLMASFEDFKSFLPMTTTSNYLIRTYSNKPDVIAEEISDKLIEDNCFDTGGEIDVSINVEDDDYFTFIFDNQIFLPYLIYPEVSPLLLSAE
nr:hypothetical protein [Tanacetum cinerariifolium]